MFKPLLFGIFSYMQPNLTPWYVTTSSSSSHLSNSRTPESGLLLFSLTRHLVSSEWHSEGHTRLEEWPNHAPGPFLVCLCCLFAFEQTHLEWNQRNGGQRGIPQKKWVCRSPRMWQVSPTASVRWTLVCLTPKQDTLHPTLSSSELTEEASLSVLSGTGPYRSPLGLAWPLSRKFI